MPRPDSPLIVSLDSESRIFIDKDLLDPAQAKARFRALALESDSGEVFVRGDGEVKYARVMDLMSDLGQAGFARVTLVTNVQAGANPPENNDGGASPEGASEAASTPASLGSAPAPASAEIASQVPAPAPALASAPASAPASPASTDSAPPLAPLAPPPPVEPEIL
jgi:hypothetical protein